MKRWCQICHAWVIPLRELLDWHCPGCGAALLEPEPEEPDDGDDTEMEVF